MIFPESSLTALESQATAHNRGLCAGLIPEIVECVRLDPLAPGESWTLQLPLSVVKGGPKGERYGASIVTPGSLKQPSDDYEVDLVDNLHGPGVNVVGSSD